MGTRPALLLLLVVTGACTRLNRQGGSLHVQRGSMESVREEVARDNVPMRWREVQGTYVTADVIKGDDALPGPLALQHANGFSTVRLRFPYDGGGVGACILSGRTPLRAERAIVETIWIPALGFNWLHPVARLRLEGSLDVEQWKKQHREIFEDPAPYRDLIDDLKEPRVRYKVARGVERATRLNRPRPVLQTWELAGVYRGKQEVEDWQELVQLALTKGRIDLLDGCVAVLREYSLGRREGWFFHEVPLQHLVLATEVERIGSEWSWVGHTAITAERPIYDVPPLPEGLPPISMRMVTVQDRSYRVGPGPLTYGLLSTFSFVGAFLIEYGLQWLPDGDAFSGWFDNWSGSGQGQAYRRRNNRGNP
ncbi:MAG: hypothetical protein AAGD14_14280 [Planctomycetota bacterium]